MRLFIRTSARRRTGLGRASHTAAWSGAGDAHAPPGHRDGLSPQGDGEGHWWDWGSAGQAGRVLQTTRSWRLGLRHWDRQGSAPLGATGKGLGCQSEQGDTVASLLVTLGLSIPSLGTSGLGGRRVGAAATPVAHAGIPGAKGWTKTSQLHLVPHAPPWDKSSFGGSGKSRCLRKPRRFYPRVRSIYTLIEFFITEL